MTQVNSEVEKPAPESSLGVKLAVGAVALLLFLILLRTVGRRSFTMDEAYELRHLNSNLLTIAADGDGFPPLFRWLASWAALFVGDAGPRLVAAAAAALAIVAVTSIVRQLSGNQAAIVSSLFLAASACQLEYAQQGRAYSLYILACALATAAWVRLQHKDSAKNWWLFIVASAAALQTHYYAALYLFVLWSWGALSGCLSRDETAFSQLRKWIAWGSVLAVLALPAMWCLRVDLQTPPPTEVVNAVDVTSVAYCYLTLAQGWSLGPSSVQLQELPTADAILQVVPWAVCSLGLLAVIGWSAWRNRPGDARWLIAILVSMPALAVVASLVMHTSFVSRYFAALIVPVAVLVGIAAQPGSGAIARLAIGLLILLNLWSVYNRNFVARYDRENYREVAQYISAHDDSPRVAVLSNYLAGAARLAMPWEWNVQVVPFYSDEPGFDELESVDTLQKLSGARWLLAEWLSPGNLAWERRDRFLRAAGAKNPVRISNNLQLFQLHRD